MFNKSKLSKVAVAVAMTVGLSTSAIAQETSSGIRGFISTPQGTPAAGTVITVTHVPTGSVKTFTTNELGGFLAKGLRVGGPYKIVVDSDTFQDQTFDNVYLQLGKTRNMKVALQRENIESIAVTGSRPLFNSTGSSSYFGEDDIAGASSLTRDIKDVVRSNPLVTILPGAERELSIAGMNPRFNSITVDGISQNDDFGLNSGGYPTQRSPLPFDALEQVTVDISPFNAKASGFSGALINANFKSGTNEFKGGLFAEKLSDSFAGTPKDTRSHIAPDQQKKPLDFKEETYGFNLAGPIIKDKLFFFSSYENFEKPASVEYGPTGANAQNNTNVTTADLEKVREIAQRVYGLSSSDLGDWNATPIEKDEKAIFKLDWNINDDHRASLTYQYNDGNRTRNTSSSPSELRLSSHWYTTNEKLNNTAFKLYSDWTENFSTEISLTQKHVQNRQVRNSDLADVTIRNIDTENDKTSGSIAFGSDTFRHANELDTETKIAKLDAVYLMDEHTLSFGVEYNSIDFDNLFVPFSRGTVEFDNLEDFENRKASRYTYQNGIGNNPQFAAAKFKRETLALYGQDEWYLTDDLKLTLGLRYERLGSDQKPLRNTKSAARTGLDNTETLDGLDIVLPRIGFNYTVNEDLTIRGGIGRYSGGQPNVWISNAYSENGVNLGFFRRSDFEVPANIATTILPDASKAIQNAQSDGNVSLVDPNFEIPSDWRFQLGADYVLDIPMLGDNFEFSAEALYIKKENAAFWKDASLRPGDVDGTTADGGLTLYKDDDRRYDLMLTNADDSGRSVILSTQLSKAWDNGVDFYMSYATQDIEEANPGTSSTARSNFRFSTGLDRNDPRSHLGTGSFEIKHNFVVKLGYKTQFFEGYDTSFDLFFSRRSGQPVSYVTNWGSVEFPDKSRVGSPWSMISPGFFSGNYRAYVPTENDPNVIWTSDENKQAVLSRIKELGLDKYAGGYVPKNSTRTPWVTSLDLTVRQQIPGFMEGHKGTVYFTVDNLLNLIDSSKGKVYDSQFNTLRLYRATIDPATKKYIIDTPRNDTFSFDAEESTWRVKVGIRYDF